MKAKTSGVAVAAWARRPQFSVASFKLHLRRMTTQGWSLPAAALLVLAGLGAAITFGLLASTQSDRAHAQADALAAAQVRVPLLLSYNYSNLRADLTRAEDQTVGTFRTDYSTLVNDVIIRTATRKKISTKATLTGAGVVDATGSTADVLVFLTQTTTAPGASPGVSTSRILVKMQKVDGNWKIAGLAPH